MGDVSKTGGGQGAQETGKSGSTNNAEGAKSFQGAVGGDKQGAADAFKANPSKDTAKGLETAFGGKLPTAEEGKKVGLEDKDLAKAKELLGGDKAGGAEKGGGAGGAEKGGGAGGAEKGGGAGGAEKGGGAGGAEGGGKLDEEKKKKLKEMGFSDEEIKAMEKDPKLAEKAMSGELKPGDPSLKAGGGAAAGGAANAGGASPSAAGASVDSTQSGTGGA